MRDAGTSHCITHRPLALTMIAMAAVFAGGTATSQAAPLTALEILEQFNAVIAGSFTSAHDVEGRLVANTMTGGATFYQPRGTAAASTFGAVNAITITNGITNANVDNGGSVNWVASDAGRFNMNGSGTIARNNPSFAITDFTNPLNALVTQLSGLTANSTVNANDPNNFIFKESNSSRTAVFSLSASQLENARNLVFSGTASTIIIDVTEPNSATPINLTGVNFNASGDLNRQIIWNFETATSVAFSGWHGTVLAEDATVTNSSAMEGGLYAKNFQGGGELHDFTFDGTLPADPASVGILEPGSITLLGAGLVGIACVRRRRRTSGCA